jgi:hypothetical protein
MFRPKAKKVKDVFVLTVRTSGFHNTDEPPKKKPAAKKPSKPVKKPRKKTPLKRKKSPIKKKRRK